MKVGTKMNVIADVMTVLKKKKNVSLFIKFTIFAIRAWQTNNKKKTEEKQMKMFEKRQQKKFIFARCCCAYIFASSFSVFLLLLNLSRLAIARLKREDVKKIFFFNEAYVIYFCCDCIDFKNWLQVEEIAVNNAISVFRFSFLFSSVP